jgi:uncharacterized protein YukE
MMNLTSLLEKISNRQRERRISKWTDYTSLVASICDGKEPDADTIATVLADNEKTLDELRDDAKLLTRRRKMRIDMDAIKPLESEAKKVVKQIADSEAAFEALTVKHDEQMSPLYIRRNEIAAIRKRANQARSDLRETCEDRELVAAYESVTEDLNEAQHERAGLDEEIARRESWVRQDTEKAEVAPFVQEQKRYKAQAEEHQRILTDLKAKLEPVVQSVYALEERLSSIEDQLLEP